MSEIKVSKLTNRAGTGAPDFSQGVKISGTASTLLAPTRTESATEPTSPANGDTWYDTDNDTYDVYINDEWKRFIGASAGGASIAWGGDRGGFWRAANDNFEYFNIATTSTASSAGTILTYSNYFGMQSSNGTRLVTVGGSTHDDMQYVTWSTLGNATSFGTVSTLTSVKEGGRGICADSTYGVVLAGESSASNYDATILYFSFDSSGNASLGGDLTLQRRNGAWGTDGTYGVYAGGVNSSFVNVNTIDYITIASPSNNGSDFGDLTVARRQLSGASDSTYSVYTGGYTSSKVDTIDYVTTATTGNATDFGDLTAAANDGPSCSNGTLAVICGGSASSTLTTGQYVTIATPGNAATVTDLTLSAYNGAGSASGAAS